MHLGRGLSGWTHGRLQDFMVMDSPASTSGDTRGQNQHIAQFGWL